MKMSDATKSRINIAMVTLRRLAPFLATVAMFAHFIEDERIETAATNGKDIIINPNFFNSLSARNRAGVLLHETLHAALLHVTRRGTRDPKLWNIAADIVVNGMIANIPELELPEGVIRVQELEALSVEEIYHELLENANKYTLLKQIFDASMFDLQEYGVADGSMKSQIDRDAETYWRNVFKQAEVIARNNNFSLQSLGIERELEALTPGSLDWQALLWRFVVQTPTDFGDFDRRMIGQGYYFETLVGLTIDISVAIDTSGSITNKELNAFIGEIQLILSIYPHIRCELYYADADLYGPYTITPESTIPQPTGGGGTDFRPFFNKIEERTEPPAACIYFTDGYGVFPSEPPNIPVLWVIMPGGIELNTLPFGEGVRMIID